jgi:choline dehydrogenase-like flavoprotein
VSGSTPRSEAPSEGGDCDVLVIGAGVAGAVSARRLAEAGLRVVCLEQGDWPDYSLASGGREEFELTATRDWAWDPNLRRNPADYPVQDSESEMAALMWSGVGGSSVLYAAHWHRNLPSDFRVHSADGVGDDWPLSYEDLRPFYERVERDFGVSGRAGDPALPPGEGPPLAPVPLRPAGRALAGAHNDLGWHWWPGSNAIATGSYGNLKPCRQLGACCFACPAGAKGSTDLTHWPQALAAGAELRTGARVQTIETDAGGLATGAVYVDREGVERRVAAQVTVLACNGIGTPRLLLMSGGARHPDGLANSSGLVGRRLMLHPFATVIGVFPEPLESWLGVWGQQAYSLEFYASDPGRGFLRGAKWGLTPTGGPLFAACAPMWGDERSWGPGLHERVASRLGRSATWGIICEDLPRPENRVVLDSSLVDSDGLPAPKVIYRIDENSRRMLRFNTERAEESMRAAGATETIVSHDRDRGWHHLGTAKMGTDPADSVVDEWGACHDVPNLYVFDGSTWPTSSGVNPTATIAAMALRGAEHLIASRPSQRTPHA